MANAFSKEEIVAFDRLLEGFHDYLVLSNNVNIVQLDQEQMERSLDIIWRPMPYIMTSYPGRDMTNNFQDATQLSVPAQINIERGVPWVMTATQLRDALQEERLTKSAHQRLAADVNKQVLLNALYYGSNVLKITTAATGFDNVALAEQYFNQIGVAPEERYLALSTKDYNAMASNLAARQTMNEIPTRAYRDAYVGRVASFETLKMDYALNLPAKTATAVINGANQYYTPQAISVSATGQITNVDNRFQNINVTVSGGTIAVGDAFQLSGVDSVHLIQKTDTGTPQTFRVAGIVSGAGGSGTITITPPIISAQGGTAAEVAYQNCTATPADQTSLTFLNTATVPANPFWYKDTIELLPGRYVIPPDAGVAIMRATTEQGIEVVLTKWVDGKTLNIFFRVDIRIGVNLLNPQMAGIILFNQT